MESQFLYHTNCPSCGSRDNLGIYNDHHYCFGCGYTKMLQPWKRLEPREVPKKQLWIPDDIDTYIPAEAHEWLNRYGLTQKELLDHNTVWSEQWKLLIFLYTKDLTRAVVAWQGRYFGTSQEVPKWWSQGNLKDINLILPATHLRDTEGQSTLVLVEDIVSAIKVSRLMNCKPLFGSYIDISNIYNIVKDKYSSLIIWLDHDKYKESRKYSVKLNNLGIDTYVIDTKKDPKEFNIEQMKEIYESQVSCYPSSP